MRLSYRYRISLCALIFFIITIIVLLYFCRLRSLWTGLGSESHMDQMLTTASLHRYNIINNANDAQPYIKIFGVSVGMLKG